MGGGAGGGAVANTVVTVSLVLQLIRRCVVMASMECSLETNNYEDDNAVDDSAELYAPTSMLTSRTAKLRPPKRLYV